VIGTIHKIAATTLASCFIAATAIAQTPPPEVPQLESDRLVNEGLIEAKILNIDTEHRMMTVRFDDTNDTAKVIVPENAEIIRTYANDLRREIELKDLDAGDNVSLQAFEVEGVIQLRIIGLPS
jgi:hypothetical protein